MDEDTAQSLGLEPIGGAVTLDGGRATTDNDFARWMDGLELATDERAEQAERRIGARTGDDPNNPWESDDNAYKQKYLDLKSRTEDAQPSVGTQMDAAKAQIQTWAAEAWDYAVKNGVPPELAETIIGAKKAEYDRSVELAATQRATLPLVRRESAQSIATEFSDKKAGVVINADELSDLSTMAEMRARAKGLANERRDAMREGRSRSGADRVESGPPASGTSRVPENISPALRIRYGLERGHL
jgi:hypothetical protein